MTEVWVNSVRKLALIFFPAFAFLFVMRYEVITLLFTSAYESAAPIFAIFSLYLLLSVTLTGPIIRAFADLKFFRLKLSLTLLPILGAALYLGIHSAGLAGAVAAVVTVYALDRLVCLIKVRQKLGLDTRDFRRFTPILKTALVTTVVGLVIYFVKQPLADLHSTTRLAVCAVTFGLIYALGALTTGAITHEERMQLLSWWTRSVRLQKELSK